MKVKWKNHAIQRARKRLDKEFNLPSQVICFLGQSANEGQVFKVRGRDVTFVCKRQDGDVWIITVYKRDKK